MIVLSLLQLRKVEEVLVWVFNQFQSNLEASNPNWDWMIVFQPIQNSYLEHSNWDWNQNWHIMEDFETVASDVFSMTIRLNARTV